MHAQKRIQVDWLSSGSACLRRVLVRMRAAECRHRKVPNYARGTRMRGLLSR